MGEGVLAYSVVLPAYLEEENLRFLLPRLAATMDEVRAPYEIIVVDTTSPLDNTEKVCREWGARYVPRQPANSFGDAVRSGIAAAAGERIIFMDADGSHSPEFIGRLIEADSSGTYDVVIASRYVKGGLTDNSLTLVLMSRLLNWTYSLVLGLRCKDVSNSFKMYRGPQLKALQLTSGNFDIVEEILFKLNREQRGLKICEIPYSFKQRAFGKTKRNLVQFVFTYLTTIIRLRFFT
jgi:dolichol-phosphate mannosyltransferase